jgi:hypothetical protein
MANAKPMLFIPSIKRLTFPAVRACLKTRGPSPEVYARALLLPKTLYRTIQTSIQLDHAKAPFNHFMRFKVKFQSGVVNVSARPWGA